jgi:hypothetical protein
MLSEKLAHIDPALDPFHDFRNFLYYCFSDEVLGFGEPDPLQYDIADWMQSSPPSEDGIRRSQIQAMRGCGKSVIACVYCAWLWYCNPTIRIVVVSSVAKKANEFAGLVKQILDKAALLEHLRPDPDEGVTMRHGKKIQSLKKQKNAEDCFDIRGCGPGKDPSFSAYPVFGGWTGSHPDVIIPDDVEIPENSLTVLKRERLFEKLRECESLVMEGGQVLYMGTPQTEESIYTKLDNAGYKIRRWPSELPDPEDEVRSHNVSPWLIHRVRQGEAIGSPSYPERFPLSRLIEKKAQGLAYYNLQFLLDTSLADEERYPLKLRNLIVLDTPIDMAPSNVLWGTAQRITHIDYVSFTGDHLHTPAFVEEAWQPFNAKVMYIDPAGSGADKVGYCVLGFLNGLFYIMDVGGLEGKGTSDAIMIKLSKIASTYGIQKVIVESNWAGSKDESTYARLLQPHMAKWNGPTQIGTKYVKGQKERRILDCLEPLVNNHRIVISEKAAKCSSFTYQFTHITRDAGSLGHEDELDAVYGAVAEFADLAVLDPEEREKQRKASESRQLAHEWDQHTSKHGAQYGAETWQDAEKMRKRRQGPRVGRRWKRT